MMRGLLNKSIWSVLFFILFFAPLALGSNRPTPLFIVQAAVMLGAILWFLKSFFLDRALTFLKSPLHLGLLGFLTLASISLLLPSGFPLISNPHFYKHAMAEALLKSVSYCLLFWLVLNLIKSEKQISLLVRAVFILGFAASLLGITQKLSQADKMFWFYPVQADGRIYTAFFSTFINANHFASFIGMVILLLLGRFLYLNARYSMSGEKRHAEEKIVLLFVLAVSGAALFMSLSRGGSVIFTLSVFIFYQFILGGKKKKHSGILVTIFTVSTVLMLVWIGLESILSELATLLKPADDVGLGARLIAWQSAFFELFLRHPFFGVGLGTFQHVFPAVQPETVYGFWRHVHNDWLEVLLETGSAGFLLILLVLFLFLREVWPIRSDANDPYVKYNGAGALAAIFYIGAMEFYDFPLRTTACAVYFTVIAALALRLRMFQDEAAGIDRLGVIPLQGKGIRTAAALFGFIFFLVCVLGAVRPYLALKLIHAGGRNSPQNLERAIRLDPMNADYRFWYGLALSERAFYGKRHYDRGELSKARQSIEKAIALNPNQGKYDYGLSVISQKTGDFAAAEDYFQKALAKDPCNPFFYAYYAIFCFNQATVENVLYEKDIFDSPTFQKGLAAYQKAKAILPSVRLYTYKDYLAGYDKLNTLLREKGVLEPNALL